MIHTAANTPRQTGRVARSSTGLAVSGRKDGSSKNGTNTELIRKRTTDGNGLGHLAQIGRVDWHCCWARDDGGGGGVKEREGGGDWGEAKGEKKEKGENKEEEFGGEEGEWVCGRAVGHRGKLWGTRTSMARFMTRG